jgi:hypothetical protein
MDNFDLRKYLAEGKLLKEDMKAPKFKIGDFVQPKSRDKYIGQIEDVYINKPENLEIKDGEYVYSVAKLNHRGRNAMSFEFKESDLESISDPTDYIKSLTPYKRRNENKLLKEEIDVNKILSDGGYDIIDDEELLMTVKSRLKGKSNIDAEKLNLLVMKIEDEEGGNIDFTENKLLKA